MATELVKGSNFMDKIGEINQRNNLLFVQEISNLLKSEVNIVKDELKKEMELEIEKSNKKQEIKLRDMFGELTKELSSITGKIEDKLIKNEKKNELLIKNVKNEISNCVNEIKDVDEKASISYTRTNTLAFTGRSNELKRAVHRRVFQCNSKKNTLEYILFHGKLVAEIYEKLKGFYEVSKYGLIPDDSFEECMKVVEGWRPEHNYKKKIMNEYTKKLNKTGFLPSTYEQAYHKYLEKTGGDF